MSGHGYWVIGLAGGYEAMDQSYIHRYLNQETVAARSKAFDCDVEQGFFARISAKGIGLSVLVGLIMLICSGCTEDYSGDIAETGQAQNGVFSLNTRGRDIYMSLCDHCHAPDGRGIPSEVGSLSLENCVVCDNREILSNYIENFMPAVNEGDSVSSVSADPSSCQEQCAIDVAEYIIYQFFSGNEVEQPDIQFNQAGADAYSQQCVQCHGEDGLGLGQYPPLVNCARCESFGLLSRYIDSSMPIGGSGPVACEGNCATNIAEFVIYQFNSRAQVSEIQGVGILPPEETYRKASILLTGHLPDDESMLAIQQASNVSDKENRLSEALDELLERPEFLDFLGDSINDMLLSRKYLSRNGNSKAALNLISRSSRAYGDSIEDYPNREWYDQELPEGELRNYARVQTNDAIAEEIVELVKYIAQQNRPFTELVTASYTMVNWYSAWAYGLSDNNYPKLGTELKFRKLPAPEFSDLPYDPSHFIPVNVASNGHTFGEVIPHSGVLTSPMFLNRYDTTRTNRNRHRARIIFDYFLDTDILAIGDGQPANTADIAGENPTMENQACTICHTILDPVAGALHNWVEGGKYRRTRLQGDADRNYNRWSFDDIFPPGFVGVDMPLENYQDNSVQWLSQRIIRDPRFVRAMTRWAYKSLTGEEPLQVTDDQNAAAVEAYITQSSILNDIGAQFKRQGWNVKKLFKGLIMSPYWRATALTDATIASVTDQIGAQRLLTPELMYRKIQAVLGVDWNDFNVNDRRSLQNLVRLYGGIDSDEITTRLTSPNGLIALIQDRYATELACAATAQDFAEPTQNRLLFPTVELNTTPSSTNSQRIRETLQHLHYQLLGEKLALDDPEILASYDLLQQVWQMGMDTLAENERSLARQCQSSTIREDSTFMVTSWMAVLTYLISDYGFAYE